MRREKVIADRGDLNSDGAKEFFVKLEGPITLTMVYITEDNGKIEWGPSPIVKSLVKVVTRR